MIYELYPRSSINKSNLKETRFVFVRCMNMIHGNYLFFLLLLSVISGNMFNFAVQDNTHKKKISETFKIYIQND